MTIRTLAAACLAAALILSPGTRAWAGDEVLSAEDWFGQADGDAVAGTTVGKGFAVGPWTIHPVAGLRTSGGAPVGVPFASEPSAAIVSTVLGFRGAARIDSRVGAIYSRLSLSFEHEFRANDHHVVTGSSGRLRNGFYGDRSQVDVMTADAVFAMRMTPSVFGFLEYGTEMEPGGGADHQVTLRLRFDF